MELKLNLRQAVIDMIGKGFLQLYFPVGIKQSTVLPLFIGLNGFWGFIITVQRTYACYTWG